MSHLPERKEKNCLNCGAYVHGRFCHKCGQENIESKESLWHLITHFFNDVTHFDGKFFSTLKYLLTRPGFLSKEYMNGKRARYLNPIRMYLFTSAIFFILFFSVFKPAIITINPKGAKEATAAGSTSLNKPFINSEGKAYNSPGESNTKEDTVKPITISTRYKSKKTYDSLLKAGAVKDNWFKQQLIYKSIQVAEKYKNNAESFLEIFADRLLHKFPQMFFVSLPLFALILKLLYIRKKEYYYTDHLIFSLHTYIFIFIALLVIFSVNALAEALNQKWLQFVSLGLGLLLYFYFYKALRNFYNQRRGKTVLKFFLILLLLPGIIIILFLVFLLLSLFQF